jgi:hypothetical protein
VSTTPPCRFTQAGNFSFPACISFLALSLSVSSVSSNESEPLFFLASRIPLSSKHSLIAPSLYAGPSMCRLGSFGSGISPSCDTERFPPGKTCAEGKEEDVWTRCRRRISLEGDIRRILGDVR